MNQIKDPKEIIDKTIVHVTHLASGDEKLVIEFSDNSFFVVDSERGYDYAELSFDSELSPFDQPEVGQITQEEYDQHELNRRAKIQEMNKQHELQQFERLKAIYGDKNEK